MHEVLDDEWVQFQQVLIDSEIALQKHKEKFKNHFVNSSEELKKKVQAVLADFDSTGPARFILCSPNTLSLIPFSVFSLWWFIQASISVLNNNLEILFEVYFIRLT